ncbi:probable chitinase 2 isoform X2 [Chelonus insularis]|uniref:probable chitinase 2 isoform X2 n=1 Tax=Chelonus insularis TaxID=460826 RepID=UPI00158BAB32|nr:probable chitinase 2 isoform X2 [Chelonus insularis]
MIQKTIYIAIVSLTINALGLHATQDSSKAKHGKTVVCYVASWAQYRPEKGQFGIDNLRPEHCTHLIYSFAGLNATTWTIKSLDPWADLEDNYGKGGYKKMTALRNKYPDLKISLAIGGWNEASANYSALVSLPERRSIFVTSVLTFLRNFGFDGLDLDWEFPGKRGGVPQDRENFVSLIKELKTVFKSNNLLLTAAISADISTINEAYDIPKISTYLDYIHVMAYDYHGAWDKKIGANAPLYCFGDRLCVNETINYLIERGAPPSKLVLGLPMYGRTFIAVSDLNDNQSPIGVDSLDKGFQGNYTRENGFMGYNEICQELINYPKNWRCGWDEKTSAAYAISKDKVVIYDDPKSLRIKVQFVKQIKLAGVMVWSIDTDDFLGECASIHDNISGISQNMDYPLMRTINFALTETPKDNLSHSIEEDITTKNSASSYLLNTALILFSILRYILLSFT